MIFKIWLLVLILSWTCADVVYPAISLIDTLKSFTNDDQIIETTDMKMGHLESAIANLQLQLNNLNLIILKEFRNLQNANAFSGCRSVPVTFNNCDKCQDYANLRDVHIDVLSQQSIWDSKPTVIDGTESSNTYQPPSSVGYTPKATAAETNFNNTNQQSCPAGCIPANTAEGKISSNTAKTTTADETNSSIPTTTPKADETSTSITTTTTTVADTTSSIANNPSSSAGDYIPRSCEEAVRLNGRPNELHLIRIPHSETKPFLVNCIEDPRGDGGAWTIIQRRIDGSIDFFRKWSDYQHGFGNLDAEFFIGLDKLHALTNSGKHELWIEMEDFEQSRAHALYSSFAIGDENQAYALIMLGNYTGNAGDSLRKHVGEKFSTKDMDNDSSSRLCCAVRYEGAWWFNQCHNSNLNGKYKRDSQSGEGIIWSTWHKPNQKSYPLKYVHMAVRQIK